MKRFSDFLKHQYDNPERKELICLLNELHLNDEIAEMLKSFYDYLERNGAVDALEYFRETMQDYVSMFYDVAQTELTNGSKNDSLRLLYQLGMRIFDELIVLTYPYKDLYYQAYREIMLSDLGRSVWQFVVIDNTISLADLKAEISMNAKSKKAHRNNNADNYLIFHLFAGEDIKNIFLVAFIRDVKKLFKGIKPTDMIEFLFQKTDFPRKITLKPQYLIAFIVLFEKLMESGRISMFKNTGLAFFFQEILEPPVGEKYPGRDYFRKVVHDAFRNKTYESEVMVFLKDILKKYSDNKKVKA